jgi:hypothetical protein
MRQKWWWPIQRLTLSLAFQMPSLFFFFSVLEIEPRA